jgi:hypothetical protein
MTCQTCGRPAENGQAVHWLGCEEIWKVVQRGNLSISTNADVCEHGDCMAPKWSDGPRTKYCVDHKDPKSREK